MIEFLQFTFSNFWIFCGIIILIYVIGSAVGLALSGLSGIITINKYTDTYKEMTDTTKKEGNDNESEN